MTTLDTGLISPSREIDREIPFDQLIEREGLTRAQAYKRVNRASDRVIQLGDGGIARVRKDDKGRLWFKVEESEATLAFQGQIRLLQLEIDRQKKIINALLDIAVELSR